MLAENPSSSSQSKQIQVDGRAKRKNSVGEVYGGRGKAG